MGKLLERKQENDRFCLDQVLQILLDFLRCDLRFARNLIQPADSVSIFRTEVPDNGPTATEKGEENEQRYEKNGP